MAHSHVLPEFLYAGTYGKNHQIISVSTDPRQKPRPIQKGFREHLLCLECEARVCKYESHSVGLIRDADKYRTKDNKTVLIPGLDYPRFKLFGLSLMWRSHISSLYFFTHVRLGPHAEKLRSMILSDDPGGVLEYPFALHKIEGPPNPQSIISCPMPARLHNHRVYQFQIYGFRWTFVISSHSDYQMDKYPFVGALPQLAIPIEHMSQGEFLHDIRSQMPNITR